MMIQIQSILLPTKDVCNVPELYFHIDGSRVSFDGYFNLFYIEKRKKYTMTDNLQLCITLKGYRQLILMHNEHSLGTIDLVAEEEKYYQAEYPYQDYDDGVFWFALIKEERVAESGVCGFFETDPGEAKINPVNIGIDICTFRRETYVARNLLQLRDQILLNENLDVSKHCRIYVIDNGKTLSEHLDIQQIVSRAEGKIQICNNMNAGGAGGFTRGMLEIIADKEHLGLTHVLMMDDDAIIEPDTLVRIYGFLTMCKAKWRDIAVGGAMLREEYPHILFCAGEMWQNGMVVNPKANLDLREFGQASGAYLTNTGHEHDWYSGWWCCCYSLNIIRKDNLPIPLFIHHDDIEFGLRNQAAGMVFLNGVGVWHRGFELNFAGANIYYDTRNYLIDVALHADGNKKAIARKYLFKTLTRAIISLRYQDVKLIYKGLIDFLKGPEWLHAQNPEKLHDQLRRMACQMKPLNALREELTETELAEVQRQIARYMEQFGVAELDEKRTGRSRGTIWHYLTYNGWLLPSDGDLVKVLSSVDSPFETFRKRKVVCYEPVSQKAMVGIRDYKALKKCLKIYIKIGMAFNRYFEHAVQDYQQNISKITNEEAWKKYLGLT